MRENLSVRTGRNRNWQYREDRWTISADGWLEDGGQSVVQLGGGAHGQQRLLDELNRRDTPAPTAGQWTVDWVPETMQRALFRDGNRVPLPEAARILNQAEAAPDLTALPAAVQVIGPCGDPAQQPIVKIRTVDTADGPMVEIAVLSDVYCWRVRSWWTPDAASAIAERITAAVAALVRNTPDGDDGD